ncbi:MAG: GNAT family N-acetyltransferase [Deltaproteobacteria bacterium]|nr:GNAT family N-acetyltransferase [Deltaproteobacteria bacterium]
MPAIKNNILWVFEQINKHHDRENFDCGIDELNRYFRKYARQNDAKNIGRTIVAIHPDTKLVAGYYTISSGSVVFENLPEQIRKGLGRYPIPVATLGRLAVDRNAQGFRLGETLLLHALQQAWQMNQKIAIYGVVVTAKNQSAKSFYLKYGFYALLDDPLHLFLSMKKIQALFHGRCS